MNTKVKHLIFIWVFAQLPLLVSAQSTYQFGVLPSLNLNKKIKNDWFLNTKLESRLLCQQSEFNGVTDKKYNYVLTDLSLISAKKVALNSRIAVGYLIRLKDGDFIHRFIQHYVVVQKMPGWRLAHRIMADQTFSKIEKPDIRLRYRITSEIPLNGETVDPGELYLKLNNEYVNNLQAKEYDLEIRFIPLLGYDIIDNFKIETGLDYRVNSFLNNNPRHSYWITFNFFIEI